MGNPVRLKHQSPIRPVKIETIQATIQIAIPMLVRAFTPNPMANPMTNLIANRYLTH
jgi:hypothetical protein